MKKLFYVLIIASFILSCSNQEGNDFVGKWVEKQTEGDICEIIKNGKTYLFVDDSGRFSAEYNEGMLEISTPIGIIKGTIDKETGNLVLAGKELIRFENATKPKFVGEWVVTSSNNDKDVDLNDVILKIDLDDKNNFVIFGDNGNRIYNHKFENGSIKIFYSSEQIFVFSPIQDDKLNAQNEENLDEYFTLSRKVSTSN